VNAPAEQLIQIGSVLHESYRIEGILGRGGMGVVYEASHLRLPKRYAIKVLDQAVVHDSDAFARFRREAEITSAIGHPNIVEVHDLNYTAVGTPYIVMELLLGENLGAYLQREGALPPARTLEIAREIASGLSAAHERGVIHRDLKPQNVFLGKKGGREQIKVLDFGISKITGAQSIQTRSETLMGTPGYMSPEQARGDSKQAGPRSDQFSLGAIVYEMLSGRPAFMSPGDGPYVVIYKLVHQDPLPLFNLPEPMAQAVMRALAKEADARYADLSAFIAALSSVVGGSPLGIAQTLPAGSPMPATPGTAGTPVTPVTPAAGGTISESMPPASSGAVAAAPVSQPGSLPPTFRSGLSPRIWLVGALLLGMAIAGVWVAVTSSRQPPEPVSEKPASPLTTKSEIARPSAPTELLPPPVVPAPAPVVAAPLPTAAPAVPAPTASPTVTTPAEPPRVRPGHIAGSHHSVKPPVRPAAAASPQTPPKAPPAAPTAPPRRPYELEPLPE
jgi:serine/threonine protein kinase